MLRCAANRFALQTDRDSYDFAHEVHATVAPL
ncbi:MAG: hypothetical protein QOK12_1294 [Mycobacterium sp.]|jgi:hypothetical protein|nr:hypothetical protein [Mycobacterium sp.]